MDRLSCCYLTVLLFTKAMKEESSIFMCHGSQVFNKLNWCAKQQVQDRNLFVLVLFLQGRFCVHVVTIKVVAVVSQGPLRAR